LRQNRTPAIESYVEDQRYQVAREWIRKGALQVVVQLLVIHCLDAQSVIHRFPFGGRGRKPKGPVYLKVKAICDTH
jgi:hypothetical protein